MTESIAAIDFLAQEFPALLRAARGRRIKGVEAEDFAQEAALRLVQLGDTQQSRAYLATVARHAMSGAARQALRISRYEVVSDESRELSTIAATEQRPRSPHGLLAAVQSLPAKERRVIKLIYLRGYSARQVANRMGISDAQVSRLRSAGLAELRRAFQEKGI